MPCSGIECVLSICRVPAGTLEIVVLINLNFMNHFSKVLLAGVLIVVSFIGASAQNDYRSQGYKGSVSITDHFGVFVGAETSHGYMFNRNVYLGAGIGGYIFPNGTENPSFGEAFLDFHSYLRNKKGTPVVGLKTGYMHGFDYENKGGMKLQNGLFVEPNVGWSWGLRSGHGLTVGLGGKVIAPLGDKRTDQKALFMPKLSIGFEF